MPLRKVILLFFVKIALFYALFLIPWPGVREAYATLFRAGGNLLFRTIGEHGRVYFEPMEITGSLFSAYDTNVRIENRQKGIRGAIPGINTRLMGYLPTAFGVGLILATPVPWRRRLVALCLGVALISAFLALELWLVLLSTLSNPREFNLVALPPWGRTLLGAVLRVVHSSPVTAYVVPVVVWAIVVIRRSDLRRWSGADTAPVPGP
jgi:hypothetical protein